ncbi:phosphocarrier protein HPr [Pullulanibacillus sp. KACC 23026]|uniref:phosphocarrier protein HPr n=1 Tax=Pullulanibacillus sp. KACC 23026 TaxID=3028315 RepID=UPI0023AF3A00|nr:phosphocarrier protein HPr [Pullulanibacillus sp. KACC 23026]WEG12894.1 phosphocarrier protein HPr [Pullulanibacillus sp. KACC 23026]
MIEKTFEVTSAAGLHARPTTLLVAEAGKYKSDMQLESGGKSVNLKSIMGVMSLGITQGTVVSIKADGEDEEEAVKKVYELVQKEGLGK